jgi:CBS domain-containing protein
MKQIHYNVVFQGHSTSPDSAASKDGSHSSVDVTATAGHDQIRYLEGAQHVALVLQSSVRNALGFEARITMDEHGGLRQTGRVRFGDGEHALTLSTAGQGRLAPSPDPARRQGATTLQIDGGSGLFAGATGMITSNFLLDDAGAYRDLHTAVIFLPGEEAVAQAPAAPRMRVRDVLNEKAFPVTADVTMEYLADLMALTEFSEQMVVDHAGKFIGVVSETDLLRALIPDVEEIVKAGGTLDDAMRIFFQLGADLAAQPVGRLVKASPRTISPDDELLAAATVMLRSHSRRLPVVKDGAFLGSVSLTDICWAVLSRWNGLKQQ